MREIFVYLLKEINFGVVKDVRFRVATSKRSCLFRDLTWDTGHITIKHVSNCISQLGKSILLTDFLMGDKYQQRWEKN